MNKDSLGDRMKGYEGVSKTRLVPKTPVLGRLDGKAFHTLTRGMEKPYDARFQRCMWAAALRLCKDVQGCRIAYVQSDEITLLLVDYQDPRTEAWFDYEVQKMCSVAASIATGTFLKEFSRDFPDYEGNLPAFDARFWTLPEHEVVNCFIWRQQDAVRNSISGLAQAHFSHRELWSKSGPEMQEMLHQRGVNWNDAPVPQKRGVCVVRETQPFVVSATGEETVRARWVVDEDIPTFTQARWYVERHLPGLSTACPLSDGQRE